MLKNFFTKRNVYICLFSILYGTVALVSGLHAISFFSLANNMAMGIMLACAFEIGQAAVLFSILTSKKDRSKIMPWVLMTMFTLVQVLGNVYSSYKHIVLNSVENLRFFKEPIFIWTSLPDDMCNVILTYIIGGILPISALLLTSMLTNYLEDNPLSETEERQELLKYNKSGNIPVNDVEEHQDSLDDAENTSTTENNKTIVDDDKSVLEGETKRKSHFVNI